MNDRKSKNAITKGQSFNIGSFGMINNNFHQQLQT